MHTVFSKHEAGRERVPGHDLELRRWGCPQKNLAGATPTTDFKGCCGKGALPRRYAVAIAMVVGLGSSAPLWAQEAADAVAPEAASGAQTRQLVRGKDWMVAAANPHAVRAGADMLRAGGSAADALVAVQTVLGLTEPQSSGLGGGAFLVYWEAKANRLLTLDARETAPAAATPRLFQDADGKPLKFFDAVVGGRSVGVPGTPKLLAHVHRRWGKLAWARVLAPATKLARKGFAVSPRLARLIARDAERLSSRPASAAYFFSDGKPLAVGSIRKNPAYARTLELFATQGERTFYEGEIGRDIVAAVRADAGNPGVMTLADLRNYRIVERPSVCAAYRGYAVCGMGPPSSGALTVGQILGTIAPYDIAGLGPDSAKAWRLIGDASRLAFADRARYMADSDFVPMPTKGLLAPDYLQKRAAMIATDRALTQEAVSPGAPTWEHAGLAPDQLADDQSLELPSTSHISIIDGEGNIISMTTTIENGFGSRVMAAGFLLNNELTDFSFKSHKDGVPIANRVEPGKRPRSSMSPTIVLKDGKPVIAIGSPGGSRIIGYVARTLIALIDWNMDIQSAISAPHLVNRFGTFDVEKGTAAESLAPKLEALGFPVKVRDLNSGLHGFVITPTGLEGGADPRREGIVIAQ